MKKLIPVDIKPMRMIEDQIANLSYSTDGAAGLDLRACIDAPILMERNGPSVLIPTGIAIHIKDPSIAAVILPRSGLGHKEGLILGNGTGLIDSDYQGELFVSAWARNNGNALPLIIRPGDRIAQLVFMPVLHVQFNWVTAFDADTDRGEGGFGSTGIK